MKKKLVAVILTFMVVVAFMPCMAFAGEWSKDIYISTDGVNNHFEFSGEEVNYITVAKGAEVTLNCYRTEDKKKLGVLEEANCYSESISEDKFNYDKGTGILKIDSNATPGLIYIEGTKGDSYDSATAIIFVGGYELPVLAVNGKAESGSNSVTLKKGESYDLSVITYPEMKPVENPDAWALDYWGDTKAVNVNEWKVTAKKQGVIHICAYDRDAEEEGKNIVTERVDFVVNGTVACACDNNYWYYVFNDKTAIFDGCSTTIWDEETEMDIPVTKVVVPPTIKPGTDDVDNKSYAKKTYKVTAIADYALCFDNKNIKKVYVSKNVKKIGKCAIGYCYDYKKDKNVKYEVTIYAKKNSAAYKYAKKYKFNWKKWNK